MLPASAFMCISTVNHKLIIISRIWPAN